MVLNNQIDDKFMKYYIKKYLLHDLIDCDNETNNYKLKYIDQNVNMGELDNTHIMIIKNNEITIVDNNHNKNE